MVDTVPSAPSETDLAIYQQLANPKRVDLQRTPRILPCDDLKFLLEAQQTPWAENNQSLKLSPRNDRSPAIFSTKQSPTRDTPRQYSRISQAPRSVRSEHNYTSHGKYQAPPTTQLPPIDEKNLSPTHDQQHFSQSNIFEEKRESNAEENDDLPKSDERPFLYNHAPTSAADLPLPDLPVSRDPANIRKEKLYYLRKLQDHIRNGIRPSYNYTLQDEADDIRAEVEHIESSLNAQQSVTFMKTSLQIILQGIESLNRKFGPFLSLDGWSQEVCRDMNKYNHVLERLYRRYFRKSERSPIVELGLILGTSMIMYHFQQKLTGGLGTAAASGGLNNSGLNHNNSAYATSGAYSNSSNVPVNVPEDIPNVPQTFNAHAHEDGKHNFVPPSMTSPAVNAQILRPPPVSRRSPVGSPRGGQHSPVHMPEQRPPSPRPNARSSLPPVASPPSPVLRVNSIEENNDRRRGEEERENNNDGSDATEDNDNNVIGGIMGFDEIGNGLDPLEPFGSADPLDENEVRGMLLNHLDDQEAVGNIISSTA